MRVPAAMLAAAALAGSWPATAVAGGGRAVDHLLARHGIAVGTSGVPAATPPEARAAVEWTVLALAAAGRDPAAAVTGPPPADSLAGPPAAGAPVIALARWTLAARAARRLPVGARRSVRRRLEDALTAGPDPVGAAWAVMALRGIGRPPADPVLRAAAARLRAGQGPDGGWSTGVLPGPDTAATAAAVQALAALGVPAGDPALIRARAWLRTVRRRDGGFPPAPGRASTGLDTAWGVLAVRALGESPRAAPWTPAGGRGPLDRLTALQGADGGVADRPRARPAPVVTAMAVLAFGGTPLAVPPPPRGAVTDPRPVVVRRVPAPGSPPRAVVAVLYRDDPGGTGVDVRRVRLAAGGADVTRRARVTPYSLQIPPSALGALPVSLRLTLVDRAGNRRVVEWVIGAAARALGRPRTPVSSTR